MENDSKNRKRTIPRIAVAALIILGVGIAYLAGRFAYVMLVDPMSAFKSGLTELATPAPPTPPATPAGEAETATPAPTPTLSPEEALLREADLDFMENRVNILMLGWDQSPERTVEGSSVYRDEANNFRSDVLMLLTVDFERGEVDLISIPRDTMASIYNTTGRWKINAAFAKGGSATGDGFTYAIHTIENLLGVPIDYYAGVDMSGVKEVVNAMGGVDYDVDVKIKLNGRVLETGFQHLDGQQVLDYCRARKGISTDVGRADRQQRIMFAIFEQLKSKKQLVNIPKIYMSVKDHVHTNLTVEQIAALASFGIGLDMEDLERHTLAGEYVNNTSFSNASFYVLDCDALIQLIKEVFGADIAPDLTFDYRYVALLKNYKDCLSYADGADYLSMLAWDGGAMQAYAAEARKAVKDFEKATDDLGGEKALKTPETVEELLFMVGEGQALKDARDNLEASMSAFCASYGITRPYVERAMLPENFYTKLPR